MNVPIILVCGPAGSGKDTVASMLAPFLKAVTLAQADPLKRLAQDVFNFSSDQLWGPSEERNRTDERYASRWMWKVASEKFNQCSPLWLKELGVDHDGKLVLLTKWFLGVAKAHGFTQSEDRSFVNDSDIKPLTPRYVLQTLGTEFGREHLTPTVWADSAINTAFALLGGQYSYTASAGLTKHPDAQPPNSVIITDGRFRNEILAIRRVGGCVIKVTSDLNSSELAAGVEGHRSESELNTIPRNLYHLEIINHKELGLDTLRQTIGLGVRNGLFKLPKCVSIG